MTPQADWVKELREMFVLTSWPSAGIKEYDERQCSQAVEFVKKQITLAQQRTEKKVREDLIDEIYNWGKSIENGEEVYDPIMSAMYLERLHTKQHELDEVISDLNN